MRAIDTYLPPCRVPHGTIASLVSFLDRTTVLQQTAKRESQVDDRLGKECGNQSSISGFATKSPRNCRNARRVALGGRLWAVNLLPRHWVSPKCRLSHKGASFKASPSPGCHLVPSCRQRQSSRHLQFDISSFACFNCSFCCTSPWWKARLSHLADE